MKSKEFLLRQISEQRMLPLYFHKDPEVCIEVLKTLYRAGIKIVEYTNRGNEAIKNFKIMRKICNRDMNDLFLGIGTIKSREVAQVYIDAGADFIISPGLVEEVAEVADRNDLVWVPGCMTPSEILNAENMGAKMIKLFPGNILGPEFIGSIKVLFPDLMFMATGGVSLEKKNLEEWFKAGIDAVGMGNKLISKQLMEEKNYCKIEEMTKHILDFLNSFKIINKSS